VPADGRAATLEEVVLGYLASARGAGLTSATAMEVAA
jgi:hypothetical protein